MGNKVIISLFLAPVLLLASCVKDDIRSDADRVPLSFGTIVINDDPSRPGGQNGEQWADNNKVGIFMLAHGSQLGTDGSISEGVDNKEYRAETNGDFFPVGDTDYYPQNGKVDFVAYYPYRASPAGNPYIYKVDVSDQSNPANIDLLWAEDDNGTAGYDKTVPVTLGFSHQLAKLEINITSKLALEGLVVKMEGVPVTADFSLAAGSLGNIGAASDIQANTAQDGLFSEIILIPSGKIPGGKVSFTVPGAGVFYWDISDIEFKPGERYIYSVIVTQHRITINEDSILKWGIRNETPKYGNTILRYKVGDFYPDPFVEYGPAGTVVNGVPATGIVYWVDPDAYGYDEATASGPAGRVIGLDMTSLAWGPPNTRIPTMVDRDNGRNNMYALETYIAQNSQSWNQFPAFDWVKGKNGDQGVYGPWYLPACDELHNIFVVYNANKALFDQKTDMAGASRLASGTETSYLSSTDDTNKNGFAFVINYNWSTGALSITSNNKNKSSNVRAVRTF